MCNENMTPVTEVFDLPSYNDKPPPAPFCLNKKSHNFIEGEDEGRPHAEIKNIVA